ncbi:hypothetical protein ACET3Z_026325 [Daucus carota]
MGEAIVADLAGGLLGKLVSLAAEEVVQAWNFHEDLYTLHQRMESVGALLYDAHNKNLIMSTANNWFDKLEAVANVANVFMDELAYEVTRRKVENRHKALDFFVPSKNTLLYRLKVARQIKSIQASFDDIFKSAVDLGLQPVAYLGSTVQDRDIRTTHSYEDKSNIVGREKDVSYLVQTVCKKHDENLQVVIVAGMGGQGKTTLARMVFNSNDTIHNFPQRMWVTVSDDFDYIKILNEMIESLTSKNLGLKNPQGLTKELQKSLKGKRFILILDDVWNEESVKWDNLRNSLLEIGGDKGSCILVTTRKQEVIDAIRSCVFYWLGKLSEDESYELFKKIAFSDGGVLETEALATLGRSMAGEELSHDCKAVYMRLDDGVSNIKPTILKRAFERVQALYAGKDILLHVLPYLTHLTVLVLNAEYFRGTQELPFSLRKMKYLKLLDISRCHSRLPTDITELYNLQTLRVGDMDELPKRFRNLINLRHLYMNWRIGKQCMFNGIERLTSLQTLPYFVVSIKKNCLVVQLGGLKNLRGVVRLYGLDELANIEEARKAKLCEKSSIQCLELKWDPPNLRVANEDSDSSDEDSSNEDEMEYKEYNDQDVMEGLEPHPNLKTLTIVGFSGKKFASWITMMLNLVKITLRNCNRCEVLPPLGHLPKLREMTIDGMENVREWEAAVISTGVSSLSEFPKLESLEIEKCPRLRTIPKSSFPSLKKLKITELESDMMFGTLSRGVSSLTSLFLTSIGDGEGDSSSLSLFSNMDSMINHSLSLTKLRLIGCAGLKCLTLGSYLEYLTIQNCPHLTSINFVEGSAGPKVMTIGKLPPSSLTGGFAQIQSSRLEYLNFGPFSGELDYIPWPYSSSSNLIKLRLFGWENVKSLALFEQPLFTTAYPALTRFYIYITYNS